MSDKTRKVEIYEKRFGIIAIEKGFITPDELIDGLKVQVREDIEKGTHRLIGTILFDQDIMTDIQINEVLEVLLGSNVSSQ
ncbi:MAG: hypothetical protein ISS66_07500 [Desulfobacteraceae bacterium]|nr:hypothetical protein [Desulfobacteraceae bacterium]